MRILMMTNTYTPLIGGVEVSIQSFTDEFRKQGHRVMIVAPTFEGMPAKEEDVIRVPAIQKFRGTDYSLNLPIPGMLPQLMKVFQPDVIHSHHPFWVGDLAVRLSGQYRIPLVFTHHVLFEQYIDNLPISSETLKHFFLELSFGYANLVDHIVVPSRSVMAMLKERGIKAPMSVIPTGININSFAHGDRARFRKKWQIPEGAFVVGYVGRLTPEKNLTFLANAMAQFVKSRPGSYGLVVGGGPLHEEVKNIFAQHNVGHQLCAAGILHGQDLVDSYHAMDVFAFSSQSETQGLVLIEAMAAGVPVVAVDAPAVRDIVENYRNGRLINLENEEFFVSALAWVAGLPKNELRQIKDQALETSRQFSIELCAEKLLDLYRKLQGSSVGSREPEHDFWRSLAGRFKVEMEMFKNMFEAGELAVKETLLNSDRDEQA